MSMMHIRLGRLYRGTRAELSLEDAVAELGVPYRPQFPGFLYGVRAFPDFFLPTLGLVLEVDDPSHNREEKRQEDAERTRELHAAWGVRVVRTTNEKALNDPRGAVRVMLAEAGMWPIPASIRRRRVAECLPRTKSAPQKARRQAKSVALRAARKASGGRSPRRSSAAPDPAPPQRTAPAE